MPELQVKLYRDSFSSSWFNGSGQSGAVFLSSRLTYVTVVDRTCFMCSAVTSRTCEQAFANLALRCPASPYTHSAHWLPTSSRKLLSDEGDNGLHGLRPTLLTTLTVSLLLVRVGLDCCRVTPGTPWSWSSGSLGSTSVRQPCSSTPGTTPTWGLCRAFRNLAMPWSAMSSCITLSG